MLADGVPWLPHQPYGSMAMMHPGDRILLRLIGAGRDLHPFHHHGNNSLTIARDGKLLESEPGAGADLAVSDFTVAVPPGSTVDAIFTWTGEKLGWDIYGHEHDLDNEPLGNFPGPEDVDHNLNGILDTVPLETGEYEPDHGKPFPVELPDQLEVSFGGQWSGSPFLGAGGALPPGQGGLNPDGGFFFMWHSHNEKEMVNNDIFPGGMMTHVVIQPPGAPIMGGH
jgi:hypothetical protein